MITHSRRSVAIVDQSSDLASDRLVRTAGTIAADRPPVAGARSKVRAVVLLISCSMFLFAACDSGGPRAGGWQAAVDTVGDTITVRTTSGSVWDGPRRLVEEVRIGVLEGDDAYMLGNVRSIAVSADGHIYAMDSQVPALRQYGPDGSHIRTLGREGGGPGEYRRPDGGLAVLPDGRVVLRDPGNTRFTVYASDGQLIGEWPHPGGGTFNTSRALYSDTAGNTYTLVLEDRTSSVLDWRFALARVMADGTHTDTVRVPEFEYDESVISGETENNSSVSQVPFTADDHWTFSPLGYVVGGVSTDYRINLFKPDGVLRIERDWTPVPVDPDEGSEARERVAANMRRQFPGWRWNGPPVPPTKPPFRDVFADGAGRIWVVLSAPGVAFMTQQEATDEEQRTQRRPNRFREATVFDVFERDGRYLGRVEAPDGFSLSPQPVMRGDLVWATVRDELDVTYIVRFRMTPGPT